MPQPIEPTPAKASTSGGSMVGALVGGALGFVLLRSALGAVAGGAAGYFFGPKPKEKADPACLDGLPAGKAREVAEFLLTAQPGAEIPGDIDWTLGVIDPATLRLAALEFEEDGFTKVAVCLRERADRLEGK